MQFASYLGRFKETESQQKEQKIVKLTALLVYQCRKVFFGKHLVSNLQQ